MLYVCHAGTCLSLNCLNVNSVLKINKDIWGGKKFVINAIVVHIQKCERTLQAESTL